ncbi:MAG TPA: pyruvate dehydrogenase (acetyl-transferring) E1 component subunit alpha [Candidatus Norongarragalinales archaeon]|nr:pyruvate dehydrogenase (acetyl-transferring) E1 component subunit alpha [Candidatus Norongarragalinales archaeon]
MTKKIAFSGSVESWQVLDENGKIDPTMDPKLPDEKLQAMYADMVFCRVFDRKAVSLQRSGRMYTYAPLEGQEASQVGSCAALSEEDWTFPTYRDHAAFLCRGAPLDLVFAYWMGFDEGMKMPPEVHTFPTSITVGNHLPLATGFAWGLALKKEKKAVLVYFGDGASSEGDFHESLNFASVFSAPCIFFCQNNQWAISVPVKKQMHAETVAQRALSYGAWGVRVDGNDVLGVFTAVKEAQRRALEGLGPSLIECMTYRMSVHTTADDPKKYRDESEVVLWKKKDPIERFQKYLAGKKLWDENFEKSVQESAKNKVDAAVKKAEAYRGEPAAFFDHVFEEKPWHLLEQKDAFLRGE